VYREYAFFEGFERVDTVDEQVAFIQTNRADARQRFTLTTKEVFEETGTVNIKKKNKVPWLPSFLAFSCHVLFLMFVRRERFVCQFISLLILQASARANRFEDSNKYFINCKSLILYSEHESLSVILSGLVKPRYGVNVKSFLHGFPYLPPEGNTNYSPSNYVYRYCSCDEYWVWASKLEGRLLKLRRLFSCDNAHPKIFLTSYSPYISDIKVVYEDSPRVVACLSNARWREANMQILNFARKLARDKEMPLIIRPHPSLSDSRLRKLLGDDIELDLSVSRDRSYGKQDLCLIYHSTLLFSLRSNGIQAFRYKDSSFDDFGYKEGTFASYLELEELANGGSHAERVGI
jgi:hypothetical protein